MRKATFVLIALVILMAFVLMVVRAAGAAEERTIWERVATLELQVVRLEQRIAALEACNPIACTMTYSGAAPVLGLPVGIQDYSSPVPPSETVSPTTEMPGTLEPSGTPEPSTTPEPTDSTPDVTETVTPKEKCNQGIGNGGEDCDPGNSNHNHESNDEGKTNRGGKAVP